MPNIIYYNFDGEQRALVQQDKPDTLYWTPYMVLSVAEKVEYDRRRQGRMFYYADERGWPIPAYHPPYEDTQ